MADATVVSPAPPELVEVVDQTGRPLCVMPAAEAHRQLLGHRSALVLVCDPRGRLLLAKRPGDAHPYPGRWDLPAAAHLAPGQSREEAARTALAKIFPGAAGTLTHQGELSPCDGTGFEAVSVFRYAPPSGAPGFDPAKNMYVTLEELSALAEGFRELLTPTLVHLLGSGALNRQKAKDG